MSAEDDLLSERQLLGCLLLDEERIPTVSAQLLVSDFEDPLHGAIYRAILDVQARGARVDFGIVHEALKSLGPIAVDCPSTYLVDLATSVTSTSLAAQYARTLLERSDQRLIIREVQSTPVGTGRTYEVFDRLAGGLRGRRASGVALGSIETVCLADVEPKPITWLWPGRLALGKLTLLAGDPGLGKSTLTLDIAARVSRGASWPDAGETSSPAKVLIATAEDALDDTVVPRVLAAGGHVGNIHAVRSIRTRGGTRAFNLELDIQALERELERLDGVRLLVIDPVTAFTGSKDAHKNAEVRGLLAPLSALAEKYGLAVLAVTHLNKGQSAALYRAQGSIAFVAAARAAWFVVKDKQDPARRLMLQGKNNLADAHGLAFRVEAGAGPAGTSVPTIVWEAEPVTISLEDAFAPPESGSESELERARQFLLSELSNGGKPVREIHEAAEARGIARKTLHRAKDDLGVIAYKSGFSGGWSWRLLEDGQGGHAHEMTTFAGVGHLRAESPANGVVATVARLDGLEDGHHNGMTTFASEVAP